MSALWDSLVDCQNKIINIFDSNAEEIVEPGMEHFNRSGWLNRVWKNDAIRRAHIDVVDARDSKGLWMMHVCVFPITSNDAPIYGFDVIAGKHKITGAFLDFSPTVNTNHHLSAVYNQMVQTFVPKKERTLPQWAKNIFSESMVAAGNVNTIEEANDIIKLAIRTLEYYFQEVPKYKGRADDRLVTAAQNYYCENQTQNPHTPRVMKSLGLDDHDVDLFCKEMLFPKIS